MFQRPSQSIALLCAVSVLSLVGCRSGFRSLGNDAITSRDPFLDEESIELVSDEQRARLTEAPSAGGFADGLDQLDKSARKAASDFGDELVSEFDEGFGAAKSQLEHAQDQAVSAVDAALFEDFPNTKEPTGQTPDEIIQAGFQARVPPDPGPQSTAPSADSRTVNAGLGSASPWGSLPADGPSRGVKLSFEDGDAGEREDIGSNDFPIDLDNFVGDSITPTPPAPPATGGGTQINSGRAQDDSWGSRFRRGRLNIFGGEERIEEPPASAAPAPVPEPSEKRDRSSIRDRFSRLGARFGLNDDDEPKDAPSVVSTPTSQQPRDCIDDLISNTQARLADVNYTALNQVQKDNYLRDHVNLRLFYLANNQNERALDAIPSIPPAEQEFWQQMFWSLSQYRNSDAIPDKTERITQTVSQLRTALQRLQETARLQLRNVSFCRRINGYGSYDRFDKDVFKPGDPVLVYAEIENFRSEPTTAGQYRTLLRSTLQILPENGAGKPLDSVTLRPVEDVCRNARRDYFNSYEFTIPNDIGSGRYVLEITVDDQLSGKSTKQSVLFSVP
jgi:hypothetical protein